MKKMNTAKWQANRVNTRYNKISDSEYFQSQGELKSLIKESAQNSGDAIESNSADERNKKTLDHYTQKDTVQMEYELLKVTGKAKKDWIEAFDFETFDKNLKILKKSSKSTSETGEEKTDKSELNRQTKIYESIKKDKPIYLLNIIDKNTLGLDGPDNMVQTDRYKKFSSFFRSTKISDKSSGGGSWGVGKNAFSNLSKMNTVIALSNLKDPTTAGKTKNDMYRIFGLSINKEAELGSYEDGLNYMNGNWFFGDNIDSPENEEYPPGDYAKSIWNNLDLAKKLLLDSRGQSYGTTIQIPMVDIQESNNNEELKLYAERLISEISIWCWPAIVSKKLSFKVKWAEVSNGDLSSVDFNIKEVDPIEEPKCREFVKLFSLKNSLDSLETKYNPSEKYFRLSKPDNNLEYKVPNKNNPKRNKNKKFILTEPELLISRPIIESEEERTRLDDYINRVALIRNSGIVVKYQKVDPGKEAVSFFGVFLTGTSLNNSVNDVLTEEFLRATENPAHNDWVTTPDQNKLETYFDVGKDKVDVGIRILGQTLRDPITSTIQKFFKSTKDDSESRFKHLDKWFLIKQPTKEGEVEMFKSKPGNKPLTVKIGVEVDSKQKLKFQIGDNSSFVKVIGLFDKEIAGNLKIKSVFNSDSTVWRNSANLKLISENPIEIEATNNTKNKNTYWVDVRVEKKSEVGVSILANGLNIRVPVKTLEKGYI